MGSLVRSEKARQSCTKFLHQVLAASSGSKFWQQVLAPCPAARGGGFHAVRGSGA
jgi:hypothetical protein